MVRAKIRPGCTALACALVGCGAEQPREPAVLAELCGVEGPVRLLAVEPDREVGTGPRRYGDHYVYVTGSRGGNEYVLEDPEIWSTGLCGEAPQRIAEGVRYPIALERWPDILLGCRTLKQDIVTLDPAGVEQPNVVFADISCNASRTPHGLLQVGGEYNPGPVALHPYPDDPRTQTSEPVVLLEVTPEPAQESLSRPIVLPDMVFLLDVDNALLRIDLPDGEIHVEQTDVREFEVSSDGRYLLWQDIQPTSDDPETPEGTVLLRDRTTGEGTTLAQTHLRYGSFHFNYLDAGYMELTLRNGVTRVYRMADLGFIDLGGRVSLRGQIADGRWLLQPSWGGRIYLSDLVDTEAITLLSNGGQIVGREDDGILIQDLEICCNDESTPFDTSPVWFLPFDGSQARRVADEVGRWPMVLDRRRMLANADVEGDAPAKLVLVDMDTREELLIDEEVIVSGYSPASPLGDDTYWYEVDDGERSGVWAVRLPAAP